MWGGGQKPCNFSQNPSRIQDTFSKPREIAMRWWAATCKGRPVRWLYLPRFPRADLLWPVNCVLGRALGLGLALGLAVALSACGPDQASASAQGLPSEPRAQPTAIVDERGDTATVPSAAVSASEPRVEPATLVDEGGEVTVTTTWEAPYRSLAFTVALDTHSVDLDGYDLRDLASIRTASGTELEALDWDAPKGGHHRQGTLIFPTQNPDGSDVLGPVDRTLTLVIRDVAGLPERTFTWNW